MSDLEVYEKKYPKHLVVMQNRILQAYHQMSLDEKRLIVLASPKARLIDATEKDAIKITVSEYAEECKIKEQSAYKQLDEAAQTIMQRQFSYKNEKGQRVHVQWVIRAIYSNGAISLCFTDEVLYMLKVFNKQNPFTKYEKEEVLRLKGEYSIDLYHLIKKHQSEVYDGQKGVFILPLEEIRTELATPQSYKRINNLKSRAIQPAIDEINEKTALKVDYDNFKDGAKVVGLKFKVKEKKPKQSKTKGLNNNVHDSATNSIEGYSDAQLGRITRSPLFINDYASRIAPNSPMNKDMTAWSAHFVQELKKDPSQFNKRPIRDYLDY